MNLKYFRLSKYIKCIFAIIFLTLSYIWGRSSQLTLCISHVQCITGETKASYKHTKRPIYDYSKLVIHGCTKRPSMYANIISMTNRISLLIRIEAEQPCVKPLHKKASTTTAKELPPLLLSYGKIDSQKKTDNTEELTISHKTVGTEITKNNKVVRIQQRESYPFYKMDKLAYRSRYIPDKIPITIYS